MSGWSGKRWRETEAKAGGEGTLPLLRGKPSVSASCPRRRGSGEDDISQEELTGQGLACAATCSGLRINAAVLVRRCSALWRVGFGDGRPLLPHGALAGLRGISAMYISTACEVRLEVLLMPAVVCLRRCSSRRRLRMR
mmetsp:Transcript_87288/g.260394  ORF Transcript_87288/g.260394 Transcript_87288/m.260394 type:complete len:139 (-) Transcript_87288:195-611(-)